MSQSIRRFAKRFRPTANSQAGTVSETPEDDLRAARDLLIPQRFNDHAWMALDYDGGKPLAERAHGVPCGDPRCPARHVVGSVVTSLEWAERGASSRADKFGMTRMHFVELEFVEARVADLRDARPDVTPQALRRNMAAPNRALHATRAAAADLLILQDEGGPPHRAHLIFIEAIERGRVRVVSEYSAQLERSHWVPLKNKRARELDLVGARAADTPLRRPRGDLWRRLVTELPVSVLAAILVLVLFQLPPLAVPAPVLIAVIAMIVYTHRGRLVQQDKLDDSQYAHRQLLDEVDRLRDDVEGLRRRLRHEQVDKDPDSD